MSELEAKTVQASTIEVGTLPSSAPTTYVDGLKGVAVSGSIVKLSFYESLLDTIGGGMKGRHVLNLTIPVPEFLAVVKHLNEVVKDLGLHAEAAKGDASE